MRPTGMKVVSWLASALLMVTAGDAAARKPVAKKEYSGTVNLNTATVSQLDQLPGVGEKAAKRIIEHRAKTPFARPEDLSRVKGFGPKKMKVLRPLLTVAGPTNLQVKKGGAPAEPEGLSQGRAAPPRR